jgi:hypothetical protein
MSISSRLFEWTQIFCGDPEKEFTAHNTAEVKRYLQYYQPIEPGLITAMATDDLSIEGLYLTSSVRQMLVQHIIALNIQATIFMPLYIGLDVTTGVAIQKIIDKLFLDRTPPFNNLT